MVEVFKEGGEKKRENIRPYTPPPQFFNSYPQVRDRIRRKAGHGVILLGIPAVADVPVLVTALCRSSPALQPSLDHRPTTPNARQTGLVYMSEWRDRINT